MHYRIVPIATPDYEASSWLQFTGRRLVDGDPFGSIGFVSAYQCLAALTDHIIETGGPWSSIELQDVLDVYHDYCLWFQATTAGVWEERASIPMTLEHLCALSQRRMLALEEFGGANREEYPVFSLIHRKICEAVGLQESTHRTYFIDGACAPVQQDTSWQEPFRSL